MINPVEEHRQIFQREIGPLSPEDTKALIAKLKEINGRFPSWPVAGRCGVIGNYDQWQPQMGNYILMLSKAPVSTTGPVPQSFQNCETQIEAAQRALIAGCAEGAWQRWRNDPIVGSTLPPDRPFTPGVNYGGLYQSLDRLLKMVGLVQGFDCQYALSLAMQSAPPVQTPPVNQPIYPPPVNPPINVNGGVNGGGDKTKLLKEDKTWLWVIGGAIALLLLVVVMER